MQYLLLIYASESEETKMNEAAMAKVLSEYHEFTQGIVQGGQFKGAERLRPVASASTVRVRNGKTVITDGPFAETREQLGGYYLIEAKNLDEAIAWGSRCPATGHGAVEVRPVWEMPAQASA